MMPKGGLTSKKGGGDYGMSELLVWKFATYFNHWGRVSSDCDEEEKLTLRSKGVVGGTMQEPLFLFPTQSPFSLLFWGGGGIGLPIPSISVYSRGARTKRHWFQKQLWERVAQSGKK